MVHRSPFDGAKIARHGRRYAEAVLDSAFLVFEAREPTADELADLAAAADAFGHGRYEIAIALAQAALEGRSRARSHWLPMMPRSLDDIRATVVMAAQARSGGAREII
jgi:hypothetical protein